MKTYHILIGNCEELLNDFIEALFQEVCQGKAAVKFTTTPRVSNFVQRACDAEFDLVIQVPHNLFPELTAPTPMGLLGEGLRAIRTIKSKRPAPIIAIVALEERARYEPLLLEAGANCVLELLCMKGAWEWLVPGLCVARLSGGHHECHAIRIRFGLDCLLP
jgi:hypothetical protein